MRQRASRRSSDGIRKPGGAAFRDNHALRARGQRGSHNGAKVLRVFHAVEKDHQAEGGLRIARLQQVFKAGDRRRRNNRDHALVFPRSGGAIQLDVFFKTDRNAVLPRQTHQFLDAVAVPAAREHYRIERASGFESFAYGMDTGETIQWKTPVQSRAAQNSRMRTRTDFTGASPAVRAALSSSRTTRSSSPPPRRPASATRKG